MQSMVFHIEQYIDYLARMDGKPSAKEIKKELIERWSTGLGVVWVSDLHPGPVRDAYHTFKDIMEDESELERS